jgi:hypothetical protein
MGVVESAPLALGRAFRAAEPVNKNETVGS